MAEQQQTDWDSPESPTYEFQTINTRGINYVNSNVQAQLFHNTELFPAAGPNPPRTPRLNSSVTSTAGVIPAASDTPMFRPVPAFIQGQQVTVQEVQGLGDSIHSVEFSPDDKFLLISNAMVHIWSLGHSGGLEWSQAFPGSKSCFSFDSRTIVTFVPGSCISVWDIDAQGQFQKTQTAPISSDWSRTIHQADLSPGGRLFVVASSLASTRTQGIEAWIPNEKGVLQLIQTISTEGRVSKVVASPDGQQFARSISEFETRLFRRNSMGLFESVQKIPSSILVYFQEPVAFSPNGQWFVSSRQGDFYLWRAGANGHFHRTQTLANQDTTRGRPTFSSDSNRLATACVTERGRIFIWEINGRGKFSQKKALDGHVDYIRHLAFSQNGQRLASTCASGKVMVWDIRQSQD